MVATGFILYLPDRHLARAAGRADSGRQGDAQLRSAVRLPHRPDLAHGRRASVARGVPDRHEHLHRARSARRSSGTSTRSSTRSCSASSDRRPPGPSRCSPTSGRSPLHSCVMGLDLLCVGASRRPAVGPHETAPARAPARAADRHRRRCPGRATVEFGERIAWLNSARILAMPLPGRPPTWTTSCCCVGVVIMALHALAGAAAGAAAAARPARRPAPEPLLALARATCRAGSTARCVVSPPAGPCWRRAAGRAARD